MDTSERMRWWLSTGAVTAGVGAALLTGAGAANAHTGDPGSGKSEASERARKPAPASAASTERRTERRPQRETAERESSSAPDGDDIAGSARVGLAHTRIERASVHLGGVAKRFGNTRDHQDTDSKSDHQFRAAASRSAAKTVDTTPVRQRPAAVVLPAVAAPPAPQPIAAAAVVAHAGKSKLQVAPGVSVDADWYFPTSGTPAGLIFLQHGNLRASSNLKALATALSQRTNSVVVAPTFQSSAVSYPQYYLNGEGTQSGVAALFSGNRAALRASAIAAGYTRVLPTSYVLSGHSAGGNMVTVVGDYRKADPNLKGVLLLDAVNRGAEMAESLARIPSAVPVYQIAAEPVAFNNRDAGTKVLAKARPGRFIGVRIVGGAHLDAEGSTTSFLAAVAAGFPKASNATALQGLAAGYITDMYNGHGPTSSGRVGVYPVAGQQVQVGQAKVVRLG